MDRKKKILQIITRLDKGGSAELALMACRKLDRGKFDLLLVYGHNPSADYDTCGMPCVYVPMLTREISPLKDIFALISLFRLFNREKPDIVQTNSSKAGFIGRWSAWLYNLALRVTGRVSRAAKIIHMPHGHVFYGYGFGRIKTALFIALEMQTSRQYSSPPAPVRPYGNILKHRHARQ